MISDKHMKIVDIIFNKIFKKDNKEDVIKKHVKVSTTKNQNKGEININYEFGFDFVIENDKKSAFVWLNDEIVMLNDGQYCIFVLESDNIKSFRIKVTPDFKSEGCHTTTCFDQNIKDSDINNRK